MKIVTMYLPDSVPLLDIHRAAALLGCYVKPTHDGRFEVRERPKPTPKQNVIRFPHNEPPSAA